MNRENNDNTDNSENNDNNDNNVSTATAVSTMDKENNTLDTEEIDIGRKSTMKYLKIIGIVLITCVTLVGALIFALNRLNLSFFYISGDSMEPTLSHGDIAVLKFEEGISPGDSVFFRSPSKWADYTPGIDRQTIFVKNITALPYQKVTIDNEGFYVNDDKVIDFAEENYTCQAAEERNEPYSHILELHQIFVTGDNHNNSLDSLRVFCEGGEKDMYLSSAEVMQHGKIIYVI